MSFDIRLFIIDKEPFYSLDNYSYFKVSPKTNPSTTMTLKVINFSTIGQRIIIEN